MTDIDNTVTHLPAIRWGVEYESADTDLLQDFASEKPLAAISQVNSALVRRDILKREQQILDELAGGAKTVETMVRSIYREYPEHLYPAAGQSVLSHLQKLEQENRVKRDEGQPPRFALLS